MSAAIIDGKAFAAGVRARVAAAVPAFVEAAKRKPGLAVVLVGADPASEVYVRNKGKATEASGMASFAHHLPADTTEDALISLVRELNADEAVDGILVQLPLPPQIDEAAVIAAIDPAKDVDGFTLENVGRLATGGEGLVPCTPLGCLLLFKDRLGDLAGLEAVVVGRSNIVGKPMARLLLAEHCTVTVAHSRTRDLPEVVRRADIVVAAVGRPGMIKGDWLKPGATVIDVGINRIDGQARRRCRFRLRFGSRGRDHAGAGRGRADDHRPALAQHALRGACPCRLGAAGGVMIELFVSALVTFLVVIDPPGCAPIFASLTKGAEARHRRAMAFRSVGIATGILLFFAVLGEDLLRHLGVSLSAFRIAGGILLFLIAVDMVFEKRTERRENRAEEVSARKQEDISVFPMAIPMIAGPGSIASIMLLMARSNGLEQSLVVLGALGATLLLTLLCLLLAGPLMRLLGERMEAMITRLLGVILAALAVQFVIDGLKRSLSG